MKKLILLLGLCIVLLLAFNVSGLEAGTRMFIVGATGNDVNEYHCSVGFDVSTCSYDSLLSLSSHIADPRGLTFNENGTKMFVVDYTSADVNEYHCSVGFDVSTCSYDSVFSVSAKETGPSGIAFNVDGTKMFIMGSIGDDVNEYHCSVGFDISTCSYDSIKSIGLEENTPQGLSFSVDGTKMFVVGSGGDDVNEYHCSVGFDVSTCSYDSVFSVSAQDLIPAGLTFNENGTKMFVVGLDGKDVNEYHCSVGFDVSTCSYDSVFSVSAQDLTPVGIAFNKDVSIEYLSLSLTYPTNGTTYYGDYNGSIIAELENVNGTASCSINDSRWTLQGGPTFDNETVHFLNNTLIPEKDISVFMQCNDSSDSVNLSISFSNNLIPSAPTNISYNTNYNLINDLVASASGSTDANNDSLTYYFKFYNINDSTLLQDWSTNDTYVLQTTDMFDFISIGAKAYDGTNYSEEYNISTELNKIEVYAFQTLTGAAVTSFNISTIYRNYSGLSNGNVIYVNDGTYNFTFAAIPYEDETIEETISANGNITAQMMQFYTFNIYRESDGSAFDTNETTSTIVQYFCMNETVSYTFNVSANENSAYIAVGCDWDFIKLDITYPGDSYYRALMPDATDNTVNFYVLDLNEDLGVQVIFNLDDLVGNYGGGNLELLKSINDSTRIIHKQPFDAEQRVVTYLLKDGYYTLKIEEADGTGVRTLGYIIAEAASEKTITVPVLNWVPEIRVGDSIKYTWENSTSTTAKLIYEDTQSGTSSLTFTIYDGSNRSKVIFTDTSLNVEEAVFTYTGVVNETYIACFQAIDSVLGDLGKICKDFTVFYEIPTPPGYTDDQWQIVTAWICIIFLVVILLSLAAFPEVDLFLVALLAFIMRRMGLLNLEAPGIGIYLDVIIVIIGVLAGLVWFRKYVVVQQ